MTAIHTRIEQIDQLTRGVSLPIPAIPETYLRAIAQTISDEWTKLVAELGATVLAEMDEAELNALLEARLNHAVITDSSFGQLVCGVARGKESVSFDGSHLEKRPDLSILLTRAHPAFPLVVECKVIDAAKAKGVALYCTNGIRRFIDGEYAWGSKEGIVIAYVRDGSSISSALAPHLSTHMGLTPDPYLTQNLPDAGTGVALALDQSVHGRSFVYVGQASTSSPGDLSLWHLWLAQ
ncbi:hypothetical protein [Devosia lacusdianchii]|uniref:hypothetical protein n=1 Tax=Devosia lacusdianchii TaxID=2917991 RepID=UPI001F064738|nr:hypothetical protein [Devosia sp. JXJ CY 41]